MTSEHADFREKNLHCQNFDNCEQVINKIDIPTLDTPVASLSTCHMQLVALNDNLAKP